MDFKFSEDQEMLRKAAREFASDVLAPRAEEIEANDELPRELIEEMAARDFLAVTIPEAYGGLGLGHTARLIIIEEIARVSAAAAMMLQVFGLGIEPIVVFGTEEQKQRYLPPLATGEKLATIAVTEATGGSDPSGIETVAQKDGSDFTLNGRKVFITNAKVSDIVVVLAKMADDEKTFNTFIAEKTMEGCRPGRTEKKMGLRGSDTGEIIFNNCRIPQENLLGEPGAGLKVALSAIGDVGRAGMTGVALGLLQASLEAAVKFANQRVLGGRPISKLQSVQFKIAEMYADLEASRLLGYRAAAMKDRGERCDVEFAIAKYFSCEAAVRVAKHACDIHGAYGYMEEYPVQRYLRDALISIPSAGTSDIMKVIMGKTALKKFAD
ncbi:MAG: acyl-CoA dehydrogenase family protein [Dethiobacteria bacterium]|jgi:alkylation response protein AidB-like acyl-CoA dehydrogenase|nr:acyl-CoA dehydrogenase [Bacillota bacterium]